jgi:hypothetical protein
VHRLEQQEEARACELRAVLDRHSAGLSGDAAAAAAAAALIQEGLPPSSSQSAEPEPEPEPEPELELEGLPTQYTNPNGTIELTAAQISAYEAVLSHLATDPAFAELRRSSSSSSGGGGSGGGGGGGGSGGGGGGALWQGHLVLRWLAASGWEGAQNACFGAIYM